MENSKLIQSIKLLSREEKKSFLDFADSPSFNKHIKLRQFVHLLMEFPPDFTSTELNKPYFFKKLFPGETYNEQKVSDLMTYCYRLWEQFLSFQSFRKDNSRKQQYLLSTLIDRNAEKWVNRKIRQIHNTDETSSVVSEVSNLQQYHLEELIDQYNMNREERSKSKSIEQKAEQLDLFYLTAKLKTACEMINRQNIVQEAFTINFLEDITAIIDQNRDYCFQHPPIALYYHVLKTLTETDEHYYFELIHLLRQHEIFFSQDELRSIYDYAQNYCIKQINSGHPDYLEEILKLYKTLLENRLLYDEQDTLSQWDYKNIVTVGSRLKDYNWTEVFIKTNKDHLPESVRENAWAYNLANLYYYQGRYDDAVGLLQQVEFTDVYYSLGARSILLKAYYEADIIDPLYSLFDSFKIYLKRNKTISDYQYRAHFNLVRFTKKLADIRIKAISARKETLKKELYRLKQRMEMVSEVSNINWVNEQFTQLETRLLSKTS